MTGLFFARLVLKENFIGYFGKAPLMSSQESEYQ